MKIIFGCFLIIFVTFKGISARPAESPSLVEVLNLQYKNELWYCGNLICPMETYGCRIKLKNDADNERLIRQSFACIMRDKTSSFSTSSVIEMPEARSIDIDIESHQDAESVYSSGYGLGGHEMAQGVIAPEQWNDFKEEFKHNRQTAGGPAQ